MVITANNLKSFKRPHQLFNLLTFQPSFYHFLVSIRNVSGASLQIDEDNGETFVQFHGKEVKGTRKKRFTTFEEIKTLLTVAGLNK